MVDRLAVIPDGRLETERVTGPWKDPPVATVSPLLMLLFCNTTSLVEAAVRVKVGAMNATFKDEEVAAEKDRPVFWSVAVTEKLNVLVVPNA